MVRELTYVRHASKKNLISLSIIEMNGYMIVLEKGGAKVFSGALVLIKSIGENYVLLLSGLYEYWKLLNFLGERSQGT